MFVTNNDIYKKLERVEKLLERLIRKDEEYSIEEISLNKASKLLHVGSKRIIEEVEKGNLNAIVYKDQKGKKRYRFRIANIREFQEATQEHVIELDENYETVEEMADRIFSGSRSKK